MEKAVLITPGNRLVRVNAYDRVYFGCEFCQHRLPPVDELQRVCLTVASLKKKLTLVTPYVTAAGIERIDELSACLQKCLPGSEVVFNDWGVFQLLSRRFPRLLPVLGRLLTKQKRDPRAYDYLLNRMKPEKGLDVGTKGVRTKLIFIPRPVPRSLYEHFQSSLVDVPQFQKYLLTNNVRRVELDNLVWEMNVSMPAGMGVSLYYPYGYISTTRLCGLLNMSYAKCSRSCQEYYLRFRDPLGVARPTPLLMRGNTLFYRSRLRPAAALKKLGIDRLVYQPGLPL